MPSFKITAFAMLIAAAGAAAAGPERFPIGQNPPIGEETLAKSTGSSVTT